MGVLPEVAAADYFARMIRVAIVDDDLRIARLLKAELADFSEIGSIHISGGGHEFIKDLAAMPAKQRPEVVIMDISMGTPEEGIITTRAVKRHYPEIEVIIFSVSDDDDRIFEAFKAGALAYLLKHEKPAYIFKAIVDVKSGGSQMSPSIARKTIRWLAPQATSPATTTIDGQALTRREVEILEMVGRGVTYDQVAIALNISSFTVKKHMNNIFRKMQVNNKIEALRKMERHR